MSSEGEKIIVQYIYIMSVVRGGLCNPSYWEDGSRTGSKLEVRNGLQSVHTIPEVNMVSPWGPAMTLGAVWRHNSCVGVEVDQRPTIFFLVKLLFHSNKLLLK